MKTIVIFLILGIILGSVLVLEVDAYSKNTAPIGSTLNIYLHDDHLNTSHSGFDTISTSGLLEFFINKIPFSGPDTMTETSQDSGVFVIKVKIPTTVNGIQVNNGDTFTIQYNDESDYSGNPKSTSLSVSLTKSPSKLNFQKNQRIGHDFPIMLYEPDANLDSRDVDKISLSKIEFRAKNGIRTTLANPVFDANSNYLLETGENTNVFVATIKIPRYIDGKVVHIGSWFELTYTDSSSPSNSSEETKIRGRIG